MTLTLASSSELAPLSQARGVGAGAGDWPQSPVTGIKTCVETRPLIGQYSAYWPLIGQSLASKQTTLRREWAGSGVNIILTMAHVPQSSITDLNIQF